MDPYLVRRRDLRARHLMYIHQFRALLAGDQPCRHSDAVSFFTKTWHNMENAFHPFVPFMPARNMRDERRFTPSPMQTAGMKNQWAQNIQPSSIPHPHTT